MIRKRDKRYKLPERVVKPKYKAVVLYGGDISYSTYGKRLKTEKRLVNFIKAWLEFNYGRNCVEHRFFVHDTRAYEVSEEQFFKVSNAGGTYAAPIFDLAHNICTNEYDVTTTNLYFFYFSDGELFTSDIMEIDEIISTKMISYMNRIGIVEVMPSSYSKLARALSDSYGERGKVRLPVINDRRRMISTILELFS